jgi:hypothetical protein
MPADPSVLKSIQALRKAIAGSGKKDRPRFALYSAISDLFRHSEKIVGDIETLGAVLAFAPEIEAGPVLRSLATSVGIRMRPSSMPSSRMVR